MKKIAILLIALMSLCMVSGTVMAKNAKPGMEYVKGSIASIDAAKNEIVVKDIKTKADKTITVTADQLKDLKVGEEVKVSMKTGTSVAEKIKAVTAATVATPKK